MKRAIRFSQHGSCRTWNILAGLVVQGLTAVAAFACAGISCNIWGASPGTFGCNTSYQVTVSETTVSPCQTATLFLYVGNSATGPFYQKYQWPTSGGSTYAQHTWTVANQANGTYWWKGKGVDYDPGTGASSTAWSLALGPYTTDNCC